MITSIHFNSQKVYIRYILTHVEIEQAKSDRSLETTVQVFSIIATIVCTFLAMLGIWIKKRKL